MALQNSDNFIVGRGTDSYKIKYEDLKDDLNYVKLDDGGTEQSITGGGGLSLEFGTSTAQLGNVAPLNDWSVYPARV